MSNVPSPARSSANVIRLGQVSVRYRLPHERYATLKEHTIRWLQRRVQYDDFWALKDVDVDIAQGQVLGIIGRNGAGKSTLLKVISRVLRPTRGHVWVRGRVAPLLEFGAGFHPELTGRENVFLNGAILGFSHAEMERKFQRIVDFAELGDFIDAPLRTYSSGMVARLGFAVATDVEPNVLIVDEVLSVGDPAFQRKSIERIQSFRAAGTTILLVTHSLETVQRMCDRVIWLDHGVVVADGMAETVVQEYRNQMVGSESIRLAKAVGPTESQRWGDRQVEIIQVRLLDGQGEEQTVFETGDSLVVQMDYETNTPVPSPVFGIGIHRHDGLHISGPNTDFAGLELPELKGTGCVTFRVPNLPLLDGLYYISVAVHPKDGLVMHDFHDRAYTFRVINVNGKVKEQYGLFSLGGTWKHTPSWSAPSTALEAPGSSRNGLHV
ncbi:MAG: ABC transporter ATP-binding protein [Chloroflexi bacterium]|nr:ABC transporter ATP-binding protein [Chloroflexota bacterium]